MALPISAMVILQHFLNEFYDCTAATKHINAKEADPKASLFFLGGVKFRRVMLEKLNPSHSCGAGPSRSQGHGRPWFF